MEMNNFLKRKKKTIISIILLFVFLGSVFTFSQTFKYGAKSQILVIQEGGTGVDPFAVSRSVEYLSTLFSQVIYSNSFYDLVMASDYNIDKSYFAGDSNQRMKKWEKTVDAKSSADSGMINITVYHSDVYQAKQIALAINQVLVTQNSNYQGMGSSVRVMVIDQPVVSSYPLKPNLPINLIVSIIFGAICAFSYSYIFPEEKYNISFFAKKKKKNISYIQPDLAPVHDIYEEIDEGKVKSYDGRADINNVLRF
jgi:capsular polysaccharide biosynthesis protein